MLVDYIGSIKEREVNRCDNPEVKLAVQGNRGSTRTVTQQMAPHGLVTALGTKRLNPSGGYNLASERIALGNVPILLVP